MAQQYGYGYGYQAYGYAQPPTIPPAATAFMGYTASRMPYTPAPPVPPSAPQASVATPPQQPSVGYSPYTIQTSAPASQPHPPPPSHGNTYSSQSFSSQSSHLMQSPSQAPHQAQQTSYYNTYKPQAPAYTPYYSSIKPEKTQTTTVASTFIKPPTAAASASNTYTPIPPASSATSVGIVGYPSYSQSTYASTANAYYKQIKENKTNTMGQAVGYQAQYPVAPTTPQAAQNLTPVQQQVVQQYITQKNQGAPGQNFMKKKVYTPPQNPQTYYCEVCKISCASAMTYKTHLDGKSHKKKLAQQKITVNQDKTNSAFYCELCEVLCSNKDGLEAHMRGTKHTKVVNLYKRMGKPIPTPKFTPSTTLGQKTVMVTAPRISFVGGRQLSSTGAGQYQEGQIKVYPPLPTATTTTATPAPASMTITATPAISTNKTNGTAQPATETPNSTATTEEESEPEPVGEHLVVAVKGDPKFPHAGYKCEMCDCYFNDEFAKKAHVKGRRHRLNYKKMYQPSLYVEPTKSMKKEMEKKKKQREMIMELKKAAAGPRGRGGRGRGWGGGGLGGGHYNHGGNYGGNHGGNYGGGWSADTGGGGWNPPPIDPNEQHRQETLERARMRQRNSSMEETYGGGYEGYDFYPPPGPPGPIMGGPPPNMMPFQPRNPHDDRLVMSKHSIIYPKEGELEAVDGVVNDIEKTLKSISDDLLNEKCQSEVESGGGAVVQKDESKRELKGVMRVGAYARGLLLRAECSVELVLMTANKPDTTLFHILCGRIPAKLEELNKSGSLENIYNVTPEIGKAAFIIITQVGDYRIQVCVTMTSTTMREEPTPEQAKADEEEGVLDRPSCLAALAALRHTKWFQAMAHNLPSSIIALRVLKDICRRVPAWGVLDTWILQLLVQKCIVSANSDFTKPGDIFRRIMECVASGLFLPGGAGLFDPCEKGVVDASANLTAQERANITLSAQHALRLIAFDKLHLVLGVDPLSPTEGESGGNKDEEAQAASTAGTKRDADASLLPEDSKKMKLEQ